ncbi:exodeoxyribonuclease V subunit gamma [Escherichia coli]|nr:exodeoxyribonuclease V subunit gamma [Escherichia coli]
MGIRDRPIEQIFFRAADGIRDYCLTRGKGDVYKSQDLAQRVDQGPISLCFRAGQVDICTLRPMRSIPLKGLCQLGMSGEV